MASKRVEYIDLNDFKEVYRLLLPISAKWYDLGIALNMEFHTLDIIAKNHNYTDVQTCLREMLKECICLRSSNRLTWSELRKCVKDEPVGRGDIAKKIRPKQSKAAGTNPRKGSLETEESEEDDDEESDLIPERKKIKRSPDESDDTEREDETVQGLSNDIKRMEKKFMQLKSSTMDSLEENGITPKKIANRLGTHYPEYMPALGTPQDVPLCHHQTELSNAETIEDLFLSLTPYMSFLDHELLENIINKFGKQSDIDKLKQYNADLRNFLEEWKVNHTKISDVTKHDQTIMCFKLKTDTLKYYQRVKEAICTIFKVKAVRLLEIKKGCVELIFTFPKMVAEQPLSHTQMCELAALSPTILNVTLLGQEGPSKEKTIYQFAEDKQISEMLLEACRSEAPSIDQIKDYLGQKGCDINIRENDEFMWSSIMWACENKHFEIAKLLLKYRPQVNIQDKKLWTPLVLASRAGDLEIVQGIVKLHEERGELEEFIDKSTNKGWTPLMWAAQEGHAAVAEFLLRKGALADYPDQNGWTSLIQASQEGHIDVVNVLLNHNAKANHQTSTTWCALMAAAKNKHSEVVDTLVRRGALVDLQRDDGSTALQVASYYEYNSDVLKSLIKHGAKVDHKNRDGMTALMLAASKDNLNAVQALLQGRANINETHAKTGWSAIFFAVTCGSSAVFRELLARGAKTEISPDTKVEDLAHTLQQDEILSELKVVSDHKQKQKQKKKEMEQKKVADYITSLLENFAKGLNKSTSNQSKGIASVDQFTRREIDCMY